MSNIITIENLWKAYNNNGLCNPVISDLSIGIEKGSFCAIMGPSGSGKTTLLNLIAGIDVADGGAITINNVKVTELSSSQMTKFRRNNIGVIYQDFNLIEGLTVKENIILPLDLENMGEDEINDKAQGLMRKVGIEHIENKQVYEISGGEKQRVAICRALINSPDIVLADEPTGNLDHKSALSVLRCIQELNDTEKVTTIMVTHDPFAASHSNITFFFRDGDVIDCICCGESKTKYYQAIMSCIEKNISYDA